METDFSTGDRVVVTDGGEAFRRVAARVQTIPEGVEVPTRSGVMEFKSSYMSRAHSPKVVSKVFRRMWQHNDVVPEFDTIVGTGLSGSLVLPSLARAFTRHFGRKISYLLVRKDNDGSHSFRELEGSIGTRWLFVDDLVETGSTLRRCIRKVASSVPDAELVGVFLYGTGDSRAGVGNGRLYPCSQVNDDGRWTYKGHKYSNESIDEFGTFHASF